MIKAHRSSSICSWLLSEWTARAKSFPTHRLRADSAVVATIAVRIPDRWAPNSDNNMLFASLFGHCMLKARRSSSILFMLAMGMDSTC